MNRLEEIKKKYRNPNENIGWLISEVERLKRRVENKTEIQILEADRDHEEIERLKKEKEWLINKIGHIYSASETASITIRMKDELLEEMQQALKEE